MTPVGVLGTGVTKFGELWGESVETLAKQAVAEALAEARLSVGELDYVVVGNMLLSQLEQRAHAGRVVGDAIGFAGPATAVEGACASGGLAIRYGVALVRAGMAKRVLVVGVEKMTDWEGEVTGRLLMGAGSEEEQWAGATFPALYALITQAYLTRYHLAAAELDGFAVKAHYHGHLNANAQFQNEVTLEQVAKSALVAKPIRQLHCSPISDGAAAVVLGEGGEVEIVGSGQGGDSLGLSRRKRLHSLTATRQALQMAIAETDRERISFEVCEVHDCFSVAEALALEDLGLVKPGKAPAWVTAGNGRVGGRGLVVNPSGGLKACGHPVGATGVKQIVEIVRQLSGQCGERQVKKALWGLTHNVGGSGATAVVHILRRVDGN